MSYPVIVVDEAQDLSSERSLMIAAMKEAFLVLLAFDEFQCLNPTLRPMAIDGWLREVCKPTRLTRCHRTDDAELLEAAGAVREGRTVFQKGRRFRVVLTPGKPNFAATCVGNAIAWSGGGTVALLTPSRRGGFADDIVGLVRSGRLGKHRNGPFAIEWESSVEIERNVLCERLAMPKVCSISEALATLVPHCGTPAVRATRDWITRQRSVLGVEEITAEQVSLKINRMLAARRRYGVVHRVRLWP